jgi:hypothetical protein
MGLPWHIVGVKGSRPGHTVADMLPRGDTVGPQVGSAIPQGWQTRSIASLHPRPPVHGEEPRGDPVAQNTADLKE